jgi:hypothetical protein
MWAYACTQAEDPRADEIDRAIYTGRFQVASAIIRTATGRRPDYFASREDLAAFLNVADWS